MKTGLIYKIECNITKEIYIGSTFEPTVAKRIVFHRLKTNKCVSKQIIDRGDYIYGLLETVTVSSRDELRKKEREWFDKTECINKNRPFVSKEEAAASQAAYIAAYRDANKEQIAANTAAYNDANKEQIAAKAAAYYAANTEKFAAKAVAYYAANTEKFAARAAAYRAANTEKFAARDAANYAANKEKIAARDAARYAANKEQIAARKAAYRAANTEKFAARDAANYAAKKAAKNIKLIHQHKFSMVLIELTNKSILPRHIYLYRSVMKDLLVSYFKKRIIKIYKKTELITQSYINLSYI